MSAVTGFGVHLKVTSIEASRAFYEDYLELVPVFAYGDDAFRASLPQGLASVSERYRGITYEVAGGTKFEVAEGHIAVPDAAVFAAHIDSPKLSAMINVSSLAALLKKSSLRPKHSVKHYYWGTLEMVMRDPDGWVIVLITPFSPEEKTAIEEYIEVETITPLAP